MIYNWVTNNVYGGEGGNYNIIGNYYKAGPSTNKNVRFRIVNPSKQNDPVIPYGKYYVEGNYVDGSPEVTKNNSDGVHMGDGTNEDKAQALVSKPFETELVNTDSPIDAYQKILLGAGASFKRDTLDQRIINNVKNGTGRIIDVQGGYPHGTPYNQTINAWPQLKSIPPAKDSDGDGMPDEWELTNGLDISNASDARQNKLHKQYTNVEVYINGLVD